METDLSSPVALAEALLRLTRSVYGDSVKALDVDVAEHHGETQKPDSNSESGQKSGQGSDSQTKYNTKIQIQNICDKLIRTILGPQEYTVLLAESCQESSALRLVNTLGIADIIGDRVVSLEEISKSVEINPQVLNIALNCVVGRGYFQEIVSDGVQCYKNNELSDVLREDSPRTLVDTIGFVCDEGFKATSYLPEAVQRSSTPGERRLPAASHAFGFEGSIFDWMSKPENSWRGQRVGKAMQQLHRMANANVTTDYAWNELASPIVDVGGGIGSLEMALLKSGDNSHLKFIIFDIPQTINDGQNIWASQHSQSISQVSFVAGNFLASSQEESNIPTGKPTYVIRHVLHDWTDLQVVQILRNVRMAMLSSDSSSDPKDLPKLLVCEMLLCYNSSRFVRTTSMQLLALNNGITRTESHMIELVESAGFRVNRVCEMRAADSIIEATPVL